MHVPSTSEKIQMPVDPRKIHILQSKQMYFIYEGPTENRCGDLGSLVKYYHYYYYYYFQYQGNPDLPKT